MLPFTIIKEFVRTRSQYELKPNIKQLLPVDMVFNGYGIINGERNFLFKPDTDYPKKLLKSVPKYLKFDKDNERFYFTVNTDDNDERLKKFSEINELIQQYNDWVEEQNKLYSEELFQKTPHDGRVHDAKELGLDYKDYSPLEKFRVWDCIFLKAKPQSYQTDKKENGAIQYADIDNEQLYRLKESINEEDFVQRVNATIFEYIREQVKQAKELDSWGEDNVWYHPNKEFSHWFTSLGLNFKKITIIELSDASPNKKSGKRTIPKETKIPDLPPTKFSDWKITMDMEKREFTLYHWGLKKTFSPTSDELGFRKGKKPENVKISTLLAYTHLKSIDDKSVIYIEHHNLMVENFGDSISTYRTYIQRVFRIYLNIDPSSKMFTRESVNYFDKPSVKKRINIYKCNSDLHTLILDKKRYNDDNIVDSNFLEYNDDINTNF